MEGLVVQLVETAKPDNNTAAVLLKPVKDLWDTWNLRVIVMFSLTLQTILIFFAPHRKRTAKKFLVFIIWSSYLLADWSANYAVGQISDSQGNAPKPGDPAENAELLAFWAPFLLLHLGGPDTITALALEDNELWLRHLFGLLCQAIASVYVFLQSIPNRLQTPLILMLLSGVIKYFERTRALYLASTDRFKDSMLGKPDPGPNYAKLMEEYQTKKDMNMPTQIIMMEEPEKGLKSDGKGQRKKLTDLEVVQYAYKYFNTFKGLVVDLIFTFQQRDESMKFFDSLQEEDALKILEVELNFIYEALFTKVEVLHSGIGLFSRLAAFAFLLASLILFKGKTKNGYDGFDVGLTYALLIGGIALDVIAILMFCLSDWMFVRLRKLKEDPDEEKTTCIGGCIDKIFNWILKLKELKWKKDECYQEKGSTKGHEVLDRKFVFRRWSEYVYAYNLIGCCLRIPPERIHHTKGLVHSIFDKIISFLFVGRVLKYTLHACVSFFRAAKKRTRKIYEQIDSLMIRSKKHRAVYYSLYLVKGFLDIWKTIYQWLGSFIDWFLEFFSITQKLEEIMFVSSRRLTKELWEFIFKEVQGKSHLADNPESAKRVSSARGDWTLRHIPSQDKRVKEEDREKLLQFVTQVDYDQSILLWHIATELFYQVEGATEENYSYREFCKMLSDYMMYLLIMQPTLMSAVGGIGKIRFRDTCEEASRFLQRRHIDIGSTKYTDVEKRKKFTDQILLVNTDVEPMDVKGDRSKSALFDASKLAHQIQEQQRKGNEDMWKVMSKVWVELLCYAATHCNAEQHAAQLSKGGELISFVWLLMAHFGLGDQFQITKGDARAKLIVGK
ncbi:PREDICTED: uncharacterized protein LOC104810911 [Tarenaya hassleriana]|uniref:uncharacterized protein LOC104810911 n=1 Tax=Tarenaya hassleriana TaxID=28532 RepID=UPI00053C8C24|nr:PREDICTED: uncharacterized protein LOC104810911 [Tarenaya hassleriana]